MNLQAYADPGRLPSGQSARVARLLAIQDPDAVGDLQLAKRVSEGLDPGAVFALGDVLGRKQVIGSHHSGSYAAEGSQGRKTPVKGSERATL